MSSPYFHFAPSDTGEGERRLRPTPSARALGAIRRELAAESATGDLAAVVARDARMRVAAARTAQTARAIHHLLDPLGPGVAPNVIRACLHELAGLRRRTSSNALPGEAVAALALCDRVRAWVREYRTLGE